MRTRTPLAFVLRDTAFCQALKSAGGRPCLFIFTQRRKDAKENELENGTKGENIACKIFTAWK